MKRIFMQQAIPGDFANYVAALTACGAEPVISMTLSDADTCDGLLIPAAPRCKSCALWAGKHGERRHR